MDELESLRKEIFALKQENRVLRNRSALLTEPERHLPPLRVLKTLPEHNAALEKDNTPKNSPAGVLCPRCLQEMFTPGIDDVEGRDWNRYDQGERQVFCSCGYNGWKGGTGKKSPARDTFRRIG